VSADTRAAKRSCGVDKVAVRKTPPTFPPRLLLTQELVKEAEPT
jgi:hypothetical protein